MFIVDNISKSYNNHNILSNISFTVNQSECIGLLGVNGSGKSTLLNILSGCIKPDSGRYYFDDDSDIGYLPQENPLVDDLTAHDNIRLWYKGNTKELSNDYTHRIFNELGINTFIKKKVKTLSGGMKKRLSLAITLINRPKLLLLDEPLSSLDMLCKQGIIKCLCNYIKDGGSIIIATHETAALDICNRIYTLKNASFSEIYNSKSGQKSFSESELCDILLNRK